MKLQPCDANTFFHRSYFILEIGLPQIYVFTVMTVCNVCWLILYALSVVMSMQNEMQLNCCKGGTDSVRQTTKNNNNGNYYAVRMFI